MFYTLIPADHRAGQYSSNQIQQPFTFCVDILDQGESYRMEAELPVFRKEDISLTIKEDVLTVSAHREEEQQVGQYVCRSFDVSSIQQEGIRATIENGVLVLTLPKASAVKPERRSISIQ